jgi:hypothetical protein
MHIFSKSITRNVGLSITIFLVGCARAPTFNIMGSYFPAWLLCILAGVAGSSAVNVLLGRFGKQNLVRWTIVVYPCLAASIAFTLWLALFS